ncbi:hypothetical protein CN984_12695 [Bacillus cereus]|uniref:Uncharacterized protein n=1 Tax=Bacillus cereus TaxID=1396 RepID=A0A2A7FNQ7_BACCE|nr:hypothetical protein [Bacillus cereus]PEA25882.1 hypothetical protein CON44_18260 [Bacillus cereus]PGO29276.1 hypothetical protein CN984_12695 [Bacillus cereus]
MKFYTLEKLSGTRGIDALTQAEERVEKLLVDTINELGGKKVIGMKKVRTHLLTNEFDYDALEQMVQIAIDLKDMELVKEQYLLQIMKEQCEKVFRDYVPLDMVDTFRMALEVMLSKNNWDSSIVVKDVSKYFTSGNVYPVTQTYLKACKKLEE